MTPATSTGRNWPHFDSRPYLRWWDDDTWTCGHLVLAFYARELNIQLPHEIIGYGQVPDSLMLAWKHKAIGEAKEWGWIKQAAPSFGDVAVFGETPEFDGHVGVVVKPMHVLHVLEGGPTTISRYDGPGWGPTLRGFYRWQGFFTE